ncbi:MAG: ATP-binding cassette domain-containing protein [Desulfurococcales archaeon]|nr:ATP-binding cassette domain-containing protein [Desulfurococcales archaeon]
MTRVIVNQLYKNVNGKRILEDISLTAVKGEILGIVGPNGIGKTTLLRVLAGIEKPTRGAVVIEGKVGLVPQDDLLLPWKTLYDNIAIGLQFKHIPGDVIRKKIRNVADLLDLYDHLNKYPKEASGGTRRKTAIARALVLDSDILLLDEPYAGLDVSTVQNLGDVLVELKGKGKTLIIVSHQLWELATIADRVLMMNGPPGRIVSEVRISGLDRGERISLLVNETQIYSKRI